MRSRLRCRRLWSREGREAAAIVLAVTVHSALLPVDFYMIYNFNPLTTTASATSIVIVARTNINLQDVQDFHSSWGIRRHLRTCS